VLEPHAFSDRYRVKPAGMNFSTKAGAAWRDDTPAGVEIVSEAEHAAATRQASNLRQLPEIAALLCDGQSEVSFFWIDQATGVLCKGRADWVFRTNAGVVLLDLKTTEDATPEAFARSCARYGYHRQAAWYCDGWTQATGETVLGFVFGTVESAWPNDAVPYMLDDDAMNRARAQISELRALHADCEARGEWPGISSQITTLNLPAWAF
jgi:exodeoxyribonuclease VIII